jgi:DNA polymerase kappa
MIMTASYAARKFGIKSGMPLFIGKKLCADLIQIKANYPRYRQLAQEFKDLLTKYDGNYESQGLDEASIDATDFLRENKMDHMEGRIFLAAKIRKEIYDKTHLTASVGIGCNKLLAKLCSTVKKPNGLTYLDFNQIEILNFMKDYPIEKLIGVGKVHTTILHGLGISTCKDILSKATEVYVSYTET